METFILVVLLCHIDYFMGTETCIPLKENPPIYYTFEKECNDASLLKRKEIEELAKENNLVITGVYSNCIKDLSKPGA